MVESDEQLLDYARRRGGTVYHPTSTCKMGGDPLAVVDAELRVHGIGGLRVADASIMPTLLDRLIQMPKYSRRLRKAINDILAKRGIRLGP